jgi:predicted glutamine amidotransferase
VSHLVAYVGNEPENVACALFSARTALFSRGQDKGWGLGFVQGGEVLLQKRPRAAADEVDLYGLVKDLRADAIVGRVGVSQMGDIAAEDADPFRSRSWLFGSVGDVNGFENVREKLLESIPDFLRRNIRGSSPSEHLFHLFLTFLHDAGSLDAPSPAPATVHGALRQSVAFLEKLLSASSPPAPLFKLALVATNGRCAVATSCSYPMRYLHVEGISDCPVCRGRVDMHRDVRHIQHEALRAVILEANAEIDARPGWHELPDRTALIMAPGLPPTLAPL